MEARKIKIGNYVCKIGDTPTVGIIKNGLFVEKVNKTIITKD